MPKTLHFTSVEGYHRWLAYGHIHNKFHGKANIYIKGKHHSVVHKKHHMAREMHEYRQGHHRVIKLGRGIGKTLTRPSNLRRPNLNHVKTGVRHGGLHIKGIPSGYGNHGPLHGNKIRIPKVRLHVGL